MAKALINTAGSSHVIRWGIRLSAMRWNVLASRSRKASKVKLLNGLMPRVYLFTSPFSRSLPRLLLCGSSAETLLAISLISNLFPTNRELLLQGRVQEVEASQ